MLQAENENGDARRAEIVFTLRIYLQCAFF